MRIEQKIRQRIRELENETLNKACRELKNTALKTVKQALELVLKLQKNNLLKEEII
jgi:hypothetical protein